MKAIKLYSDNFNGALLTEDAYKEVRLQMSTGDFHTHKIKKVNVNKKAKLLTLNDILLPQIAAQLKLTHDGHGDTRLFYDEEHINVFASDMSKAEYKAMEKDINSFLIKGKGFEVYAWNDCSGYEYWSSDKNECNYIQITANISDAKKVNLEKLKEAIQKAFDKFYRYDNTDYHDFSREGSNE